MLQTAAEKSREKSIETSKRKSIESSKTKSIKNSKKSFQKTTIFSIDFPEFWENQSKTYTTRLILIKKRCSGVVHLLDRVTWVLRGRKIGCLHRGQNDQEVAAVAGQKCQDIGTAASHHRRGAVSGGAAQRRAKSPGSRWVAQQRRKAYGGERSWSPGRPGLRYQSRCDVLF